MQPIRLLALLGILSSALPSQQGQVFAFVEGGTATGLNASNQPSKIAARVGTRIASFTPAASSTFAQHAPQLVTAGVNAGLAILIPTPPAQWVLNLAGGQPIQSGCVFGFDDTGLNSARITVRDFVPVDKTHGVAFAKPLAGSILWPFGGNISMFIQAHNDATSATLNRTINVSIPPLSTGNSMIDRIRQALTTDGVIFNDVILANPFSTTGTQTYPGFGLDRYHFRVLTTTFTYKVNSISITYDSLISPLFPKVFSGGWYPSGGFTEYGTGRSEMPTFEPWIRGEGSYAPGTSYDVIADFARPSSQGVLLVGAGRGGYTLPGSLYVLIDFALPTLTLPGQTDANGELKINIALPPDAGLVGIALFHQAFVASPSLTIEASSGLFCRIWQ